MTGEYLVVKGAREHNLKNLTLRMPRGAFIVITGLSGSGKSSLAFDTIYAEGQRRYVESLSSYARQFLEQMEKPDVDSIEGLSPAISIDQKTTSRNPRSTVGTITEIHDYLRVLFARTGTPHCPGCGRTISRQTVSQIVDRIMESQEGSALVIMAPVVRGRKGEHRALLSKLSKDGYTRVRVDGKVFGLDGDDIKIDKNRKHDIEVIVDRLKIRPGIERRLSDSAETAAVAGGGVILVEQGKDETLYSLEYSCPWCGGGLGEISPRIFSFNSPYGACEGCHGLGTTIDFSMELVVPDSSLSIREGALAPVGLIKDNWFRLRLEALSKLFRFSLDTPFERLSKKNRKIILEGSDDEITVHYDFKKGRGEYTTRWEGIIPNLRRRYHQTGSEAVRKWIETYMISADCRECGGSRLRKESLSVLVAGRNIAEISHLTIDNAAEFFSDLKFSGNDSIVGEPLLKEITSRLDFLKNVGLDYLALDRSAGTLAGGEAQRIRLATQIGSKLVGVLYILDEPSIGLHQRDNARLIATLKELRDAGNTVIVIEHDRETILAADHVIDLGPGAGEHGGYLVAAGSPEQIIETAGSLTGRFLRTDTVSDSGPPLREGSGVDLVLRGARANNLKNIDVAFPIGKLICVTGVSGSGKSTLVNDILFRALHRRFFRSRKLPGPHDGIDGAENIDKVINIDQSPIGRTPRSNPATYTGIFGPVRDLFSRLPESKIRGYRPGRFSFNVKGGRCEVCSGDGMIKVEMHFLPDVYVHCQECKGKRYNRETLEVFFKNRNIAEVLELTVDEAIDFFENIPSVRRKLQVLQDVGLGYIRLGQPATTLSGGEAQRVKLSSELSKVGTGKTLYILDEPSTGLHFEDVKLLMAVLGRLVDRGNTVLVIEHNPDIIRHADHIIDLGPEGGERGGEVIYAGAPAGITGCDSSWTGKMLKDQLRPVNRAGQQDQAVISGRKAEAAGNKKGKH
ncbi:MAG: excinuclease ABC subunit UvrA [Candidatus Krumholzibacteriota bacterium]|nr:excinuclease ABC subunit UvrA [Candidatus Krumholzibacteriota bacterium]